MLPRRILALEYAYVGTELDVFARAENWKAYYGSFFPALLEGDVLEVGAGLGATARALCDGRQRSWVCLEPDPVLAGEIEAAVRSGRLPVCCQATRGDLTSLPPGALFDCILYIDVLEHIADDFTELARAARRLKTGGHLVVVAPAHSWLYTPFDEAIGHHRRYTRRSLAERVPRNLTARRLVYLDSVGLLLSLGNRVLLRSSRPTHAQIQFWDRVVIPVSRRLDPLLCYQVGKTVMGIWQNEGEAAAVTIGSPAQAVMSR
jgi:2-polyprenyl-3-methyl-5-hydroxy-6-metoxy-1,4-benzoquinol methylase